MSDNDKFNECLECSGCSCESGQGCACCSEGCGNTSQNQSAAETSDAVESSSEPASQQQVASSEKEVEINPMDLEQVAQKTEDLLPRVDPSRGKLDCFNYLADIPGGKADYDIVEVQFKNTRKGFYRNTSNLDLHLGDMVAVESQPGHDIGRVTLVGHLVRNQMKKAGLSEDSEIRKIFRFARPADMEKYYEAKALEIPTMIGSRQIAAELGLKMKIGDVEYQGDGLKAIFYYIADERVDFRQLIKILAERYKIRVEMRQIGARQEAGRIGGIGPCGRPLCCSTWMTNFVTVATSAARHQDLSLNPQKLAGQCAKLKCCLNFEIDTYLESVKKMPSKEARLETLDGSWYHFKTDIFKGEITYSSDKKNAVNTIIISAERAFEIIEMNNRGEKPLSLIPDEEAKLKAQGTYNDILGDDSQISRFDKKKKKKKKKKDKDAAAAAAVSETGTSDGNDAWDDSNSDQPQIAQDDNVQSSNDAKANPSEKRASVPVEDTSIQNRPSQEEGVANADASDADSHQNAQPLSLKEENHTSEAGSQELGNNSDNEDVNHAGNDAGNEDGNDAGNVPVQNDENISQENSVSPSESFFQSSVESVDKSEDARQALAKGREPSEENNEGDVAQAPHGKEQGLKGANNKPQWQGKNQGKGFKPQHGKGAEQSKNREQGKGNNPNRENNQPSHHHGQPNPAKVKGQNPPQDNRGNKDNSEKGPRPQRQGDQQQRHDRHGNPSQGQSVQRPNGPKDESRFNSWDNNKKKKKKHNPSGDNSANQGAQNQGEQPRQGHQGHNDSSKPGHGGQDPHRHNHGERGGSNQNPAGGPTSGSGNAD